jgi:hypothetical protein
MVSGDVVAAAKRGRRNALRRRSSERDPPRTFRDFSASTTESPHVIVLLYQIKPCLISVDPSSLLIQMPLT